MKVVFILFILSVVWVFFVGRFIKKNMIAESSIYKESLCDYKKAVYVISSCDSEAHLFTARRFVERIKSEYLKEDLMILLSEKEKEIENTS